MRQESLKGEFQNLIAPQIECNPDKRYEQRKRKSKRIRETEQEL